MKLLENVINELVDANISLSSPLLKTKVLASRINNISLLDWVNKELSGYSNIVDVPDYRKFNASVYATYLNGRWKVTNQVISLSVLPENIRNVYENADFTESIESLEALQKSANNHVLSSRLSADQISLLEYYTRKNGNPDFQILSASKQIPSNVITQVLSDVRSQLLDFILQLEHTFGEEVDIKTLKERQTEIITIMNQTINNNGDGIIVNTGSNNSINAHIKVIKKDKESLVSALKDQNISDEDIFELTQIIDTEEPESDKKFGIKVRNWFTKMISKSLDGTWQIAAGAAGGILTEIIKHYYGL